jgi:mycofactocin precursor
MSTAQATPATEQPDAPVDVTDDEIAVEEVLVDEVSIDGMCGVY